MSPLAWRDETVSHPVTEATVVAVSDDFEDTVAGETEMSFYEIWAEVDGTFTVDLVNDRDFLMISRDSASLDEAKQSAQSHFAAEIKP